MGYINKFKKGNEEFDIKALSADTAILADTATSASTAENAANADAIGNVEKYSGFIDGKQREGLKIKNGKVLSFILQNKQKINPVL